MDWGDIGETILTTGLDYLLGPLWDPAAPGPTIPTSIGPGTPTGTSPGPGGSAMTPHNHAPVPPVGASGSHPPGGRGGSSGWLWDPHNGRWVKRRRRRKRLLTESDYTDLVKIQTLSNSKNIQIGLAKALGR